MNDKVNGPAGTMKIWNQVSKTDPSHTKTVSFGRKFTAIDAHYQIMKMTEIFGPVGEGWGYHVFHGSQDFANGCVLAWSDVTLWHTNRDNTFGPFRGASELVTVKAKDRIDTDAWKKSTTDALTKLASHIGLNADVFLGKFDDNKYVQERKQEEQKEVSVADAAKADVEWAQRMIDNIDKIRSVDELHRAWEKIKPMLEDRDGTAALMITDRIKLKRFHLNKEEKK